MVDSHYYSQFRGNTFVIHAESQAVDDHATTQAILQEIDDLLRHEIRVLLVFGKGDLFEAEMRRDFGAMLHPETNRLVIPELALPRIQQQRAHITGVIEAICRTHNISCQMIGQEAVRVERRIGHGSTGVPTQLDVPGIQRALEQSQLAVIGFGGVDDDGKFLHVPSVSLAADLAVALGAQKLVFLMHSDGISIPHPIRGVRPLSFADVEELLCLLQRQGPGGEFAIAGEALPKVHASIGAVCGGVGQVHLVSYRRMLEEILSRTGVGTMIEFRQSHHVDYADPEDLAEIVRLHCDAQRFCSPLGTPYVYPLDRAQLEQLLPSTLVLRHRDVLIGKLHIVPVSDEPGTWQIGGFVIAENHQDSQQGQLLLTEALARLREQGHTRVVAITASQRAKALFQRLGGLVTPATESPSARVQQALQRYQPQEHDQVSVVQFRLEAPAAP